MTDDAAGALSALPKYNPLFEVFTDPAQASSDIAGLVAYALYKLAKVEWSTQYREQNGTPPTDAALDTYQATWTPGLIQALRDQADSAIAAFGQSAVDQARAGIREEALRGSFWRGVWQSMVAAFFYTLALIGLTLVLRVAGVDVIGIFQKLDVSQSASPMTPAKALTIRE